MVLSCKLGCPCKRTGNTNLYPPSAMAFLIISGFFFSKTCWFWRTFEYSSFSYCMEMYWTTLSALSCVLSISCYFLLKSLYMAINTYSKLAPSSFILVLDVSRLPHRDCNTSGVCRCGVTVCRRKRCQQLQLQLYSIIPQRHHSYTHFWCCNDSPSTNRAEV